MAEPGEVCDDDDPMGLVEGYIATVLFQQGADQSPSRKKWNGLHYESRKSPGKRKRIFPTAKCEHGGCYQFSKSEDGRRSPQDLASLELIWISQTLLAGWKMAKDFGSSEGGATAEEIFFRGKQTAAHEY
jgi:hypothetical protein